MYFKNYRRPFCNKMLQMTCTRYFDYKRVISTTLMKITISKQNISYVNGLTMKSLIFPYELSVNFQQQLVLKYVLRQRSWHKVLFNLKSRMRRWQNLKKIRLKHLKAVFIITHVKLSTKRMCLAHIYRQIMFWRLF